MPNTIKIYDGSPNELTIEMGSIWIDKYNNPFMLCFERGSYLLISLVTGQGTSTRSSSKESVVRGLKMLPDGGAITISREK